MAAQNRCNFVKLKQEKMLSASQKTIDITGFFRKFYIAIRTTKKPTLSTRQSRLF